MVRSMNRKTKSIILSLHPKWADLIKRRNKTIELRRRFPERLRGSVALIYQTSPKCALSGAVLLGDVIQQSVDQLWSNYGQASCVTQEHFETYYQGRSIGVAIEIVDVMPSKEDWTLEYLRAQFGFTAPQSWAYAPAQLASALGYAS